MIELINVSKTYNPKRGPLVTALNNVNLTVDEYGMVFILGKSGSGKSTLLNVIGGLDRIDSGEIVIHGKSSAQFSQADFDSYRNTYLGFIFQEYNILNDYTVKENIGLALDLQGKSNTDRSIDEILLQVGLENYGNRKPNELSGGEKQRVAIARALVKNPDIILADEPTGALDSKTAGQVFDTLKELSATRLVLVVSHDREFAEQYADRIITLADGNIIDDVQLTEGKSTEEGLKVVDDKIIHIKKGYALTEQDKNYINEFLQKSDSDTIISIDDKTNSDVKKARHITEKGVNSFCVTDKEKIKRGKEKSFSLIKSHLPLKDCLKLGAHALNVKRFRLIITIILSVIAFTLFGMADTLAAYNPDTTNANSIISNGVKNLTVQKKTTPTEEEYYYDEEKAITQADLTLLESKLKTQLYPVYGVHNGTDGQMEFSYYNNVLDYTKLYNWQFNNNASSYYRGSFCGLFESNQQYMEDLGFVIHGAYPVTTEQVAITDYTYRHFTAGGYVNVIITEDGETTGGNNKEIRSYNDIIGETICINGYNYTITGVIDTKLNQERYNWFFEERKSNNLFDLLVQLVYSTEISYAVQSGYHALAYGCEGFATAHDVEYELSREAFSRVIAQMPTSAREISNAIEVLEGSSNGQYTFYLANEITMLVGSVDSILSVVSDVFVFIAVGFAVFACLMLSNFISVSIINKKKDIGILRAVGAGSMDVFGIFFSESLIIALINFVASALITGICALAGNITLKTNGIIITIFNFGFRQIGILLLICIFSAFISSLLPIWKFARKKPIDAINDR